MPIKEQERQAFQAGCQFVDIEDQGNETNATKTDSLRNCLINWCLSDPTVLRIPTSFALFSLRAVERFMKLIQASISTNTPIIANNQTNCMRPPSALPFLKSL